jgi:hypothetical protein
MESGTAVVAVPTVGGIEGGEEVTGGYWSQMKGGLGGWPVRWLG